MQLVKIKFCDRSITFANSPLNLWNFTDFYVIVQDVDQPAFAYLPSPSPPRPSPPRLSSSILVATSSVRNFISATFDIAITNPLI